ncbi:MAG: hypothetical protein GY906_24645 [bacterium]|nr:hypothetical protein [bacterium]
MSASYEEAVECTKFLTAMSRALIKAEERLDAQLWQGWGTHGIRNVSLHTMELETLIFGWSPPRQTPDVV